MGADFVPRYYWAVKAARLESGEATKGIELQQQKNYWC